MSEMTTLEEQLNEFAGVGEVQESKPQRKPRKLRQTAKHVPAFETGVPLPGEEPPASLPVAPRVYAAISAVTAGLAQSGIGKDRRNQQQGYNFRGIDDVYNALSRLLVKHGLVILPRVEDRVVSERSARGGGMLNYVTIKMTFDLVSTVDGSREQVSSFGEAMDSGDKATNKALSTAYKYMAMQVFCIPTIGIDPEEDTYEVTSPVAEPKKPAPTQVHQFTAKAPPDARSYEQSWTQESLPDVRSHSTAQRERTPSAEHVKTLLRTANEMKLLSAEEATAWFNELLPEDQETLRKAKQIRKTQRPQS